MSKSYTKTNLFLFSGLLFLMVLHLSQGMFDSVFRSAWWSVFDFDNTLENHIIFREIRFPRMWMGIIAGAGLSLAGLLMQTLFNNPLAGPSVLGISSGSSLFVALAVLSGIPFFSEDLGTVGAALIGAIAFCLLILFFTSFVKAQISLLLIGIMLASFTSAIVQILQKSSSANQLKVFTLWSFGSLQDVNFNQLGMISLIFILTCSLFIFLIKPLNALVLGEKSSAVLGFQLQKVRFSIIFITAILVGLVTAFCGPISFIGLAVPNLVRLLYKTQNHGQLLLGSALLGAITLLFCDLMIQYMETYFFLPLNGITALIGSPIVVWILVKRFR